MKKSVIAITFIFILCSILYGGISYTVNHTRGIVIDNTTKLVWNRCSFLQPGLINTHSNCNGLSKKDIFSWDESISLCNELKNKQYLGYSNWRLPNIRELQSIADYTYGQSPSINQSAFPNMIFTDDGVYHYWSSTPNKNNPGYAWFIDFYNGTVAWASKTNEETKYKFVRCVAGPSK